MEHKEINLNALVGEAERTLLVRGLQALYRERTLAWNTACAIAADRGLSSPPNLDFGLDEVSDMLRRVGAAPGAS